MLFSAHSGDGAKRGWEEEDDDDDDNAVRHKKVLSWWWWDSGAAIGIITRRLRHMSWTLSQAVPSRVSPSCSRCWPLLASTKWNEKEAPPLLPPPPPPPPPLSDRPHPFVDASPCGWLNTLPPPNPPTISTRRFAYGFLDSRTFPNTRTSLFSFRLFTFPYICCKKKQTPAILLPWKRKVITVGEDFFFFYVNDGRRCESITTTSSAYCWAERNTNDDDDNISTLAMATWKNK